MGAAMPIEAQLPIFLPIILTPKVLPQLQAPLFPGEL
jgi:hypothetical protein